MKIENHILQGAEWIESPNRSGAINPGVIVMHYTAGYTAGAAIRALTDDSRDPRSRVSAHIVIDRDGSVTQLVPFNVKAWHAGPSIHGGRRGVNNFSIGIELVGIGFYRQRAMDGKFANAYGGIRSKAEIEREEGRMVEAPNARVGSGMLHWPEYAEPQLDSCRRLVRALIAEYGIREIVSHEEIDLRKWKTDPGPAFPMREFRAMLDEGVLPALRVTADVLNVRGGPGTRYPIVGSLARGERVRPARGAMVGDWACIGGDRWVHSGWLS